jgi:hypothetical protein
MGATACGGAVWANGAFETFAVGKSAHAFWICFEGHTAKSKERGMINVVESGCEAA